MSERKTRSDSKLKTLPEDVQEELWLLMYPDDVDTEPCSQAESRAHLAAEYDVGSSASSFSEWHAWYSLKRRMLSATERAEQARFELAKDSDLSPDDIQKVAQAVFSAEALSQGDVKAYVQLAKIQLKLKQLEHDARRIALLESKAKQLDEAKEKAAELKAGGLSEETLELLEKQLKLL